ncbi:hypothetical protein ACS386_09635 [Flavobacteriaceae bacterium LMO-SS05]
MKKLSLIILLIVGLQIKGFAQNNINNYKYVIVPLSYNFIEGQDRYDLNSLTKFLFNKYGYSAFLQNEELPSDLKNNRCLAMLVNVEKEKGFLRTKLRIDLLDCNNNLIMSSRVGNSNEKAFDKAYTLALRDAFETFQFANYQYEPSHKITSVASEPVVTGNTVEQEKEIERLQEELKSLKEEKKMESKQVEASIPAVIEAKADVKEAKAEVKEVKKEAKEPKIVVKEASYLLYAQPIEHGFQVVDTTPKVVMILMETAKSNIFIVKGQNAIVYKEEGSWFLSKNDGNTVSLEALNIKF